MIILLASIAYSYEAPDPGFAPLLHSAVVYNAPQPGFAPLLHGEPLNFSLPELILNGPQLVDTCGTITLFHNINLTCQFNASSNFTNTTNAFIWAVNDSRVNLAVDNATAYVVDNASLSDYNMPGCWDINVSVTDAGDTDSDSHIFKYCINDSAPVIDQNCGNINISHSQNLSCNLNASDAENDGIFWTNNESRITLTLLGPFNYTANTTDDPLITDYNAPGGWDILINITDGVLYSEFVFNYVINNTLPTFDQVCSSVHLFHNVNLSCQFNATDNDSDIILWLVNDSRVNITNEGFVIDNASLSDYNMPDGWSINVTVHDGLFNSSTLFTYQINDTAPVFVNSCDTVHLFHSQNLTCQFNATDAEDDAITFDINDSRVTITQDGFVVDNATLQEYNMPNGWDLEINITDTVLANATFMVYQINDTAPQFTELFGPLSFINTELVNFAANFTDFELDDAELGINCTILNATVFNNTITYNLSRQIDLGSNGTVEVCQLDISDTVLNSSQTFTVTITLDPDSVATFTVTVGTNMSAFYPDLTIYFNQTNFNLQLTNSSNNPQENMTATNPYLVLNNTDTQQLNVTCQVNMTFSDIFFNVSTNFTGAKQPVTNVSTLVATNISPGTLINVFPFFDYLDYNFTNTSARNDDANLTCQMVVP